MDSNRVSEAFGVLGLVAIVVAGLAVPPLALPWLLGLPWWVTVPACTAIMVAPGVWLITRR